MNGTNSYSSFRLEFKFTIVAILEIIDYNIRNAVISFLLSSLAEITDKKDLFAVSVDKLAINRPT